LATWDYIITTAYQQHFSYGRNAQNVVDYLQTRGFSNESIVGILANMEHESSINCGQMEHGYNGSVDRGYGLVQWTPARTKILAYADSVGGNWYDGDLQMDYLMINAPASWIKTSNFPYSWEQFKQMSDIYLATRTFFACFERGTFHNDLLTYADYWSTHVSFSGETPVIPPDKPPIYRPNPDISLEDSLKIIILMCDTAKKMFDK
jgi:hypothetical protein